MMTFTHTHKNIITIAILFMAALLQGCAGMVKLTDEDRAELKSVDQVKAVYLRAGWPSIQTPMGVLASNLTFGMSEDWSAGQKLVKKFDIADPSKMAMDKFVAEINRGAKVANFVTDAEPLAYEDRTAEKMKEKFGQGVVLQFSSPMWQIWYYPMNWVRYQMWYGTSAQLIRLDDAKVLWSGRCRADQKDSETAPTFDELTGDNSTVLKAWVEDSTARCAKELIDDFMGKV